MIRAYHNGTMEKLLYLLENKEQAPAWRIEVTAKAVLARALRVVPVGEGSLELIAIRDLIGGDGSERWLSEEESFDTPRVLPKRIIGKRIPVVSAEIENEEEEKQ